MTRFFTALALTLTPLTASASSPTEAMIGYAQEQVQAWVVTPEVVAAIKAQNERTASMSQSEIDGLDKDWRAKVGCNCSPFVQGVLENETSQHLAAHAAQSGGMVTEVFVMDARGLNVGQSGPTSDYWQGDEAKFQQTFLVGPDAVHASDIELDESTQTYQAQISRTITDPETGAVIGAVTIGLNAQNFF